AARGLALGASRAIGALDSAGDACSVASATYSSRFPPAVTGTVHLAALRLRDRLAGSAAGKLNVAAEDIEFVDGKVRARGNPDNAIPFARLAAGDHWSPGETPERDHVLRETVFWTPPQLATPNEADEINAQLCHAFIFDFCGVEIDRDTGAVRIDKYVTMRSED